jgi:ribosomal protein S18 acetylase RimI-like enzyme
MIRAFDGSLADAEGLLTVERATFDECPYTAQEVQAMLQPGSGHSPHAGAQCAWLAVEGDSPFDQGSPQPGDVAGFVIAFSVNSRQGTWWEIDLVAVHPDRQGRGLGRQLIRAAAAGGMGQANRSRAVVATDNGRSARAFAHAGFQAEPSACTLLIHRLREQAPRPQPAPDVSVHEAASTDEAAAWHVSWPAASSPGPTLLLAEQHGRPAGYAELITVETLLYRGIWIESLAASGRAVRDTLVCHAMNRAMASGLDEVSAMVPRQNRPLLHTLLAGGFHSLGAYRWFSADLPLGPEGAAARP